MSQITDTRESSVETHDLPGTLTLTLFPSGAARLEDSVDTIYLSSGSMAVLATLLRQHPVHGKDLK